MVETAYPPLEGEPRQPVSLFVHVLLPFLSISFALAFRQTFPGLAWRLALFVGLCAILLTGTKYDAGESMQNYSMGCMFGSIILNVVAVIFLTDPCRDWRHETQKVPTTEMPWWKRMYLGLCILCNSRSIGWSNQIEQLPPAPKYTRIQFVLTRLPRIAWYAFLADVASTYVATNPIFALTGTEARSLRAQGLFFTPLNVVGYMAMSHCTFNMTYDVIGLLAVATGYSEPKYWPVPFGRWRDSYTIRRFWGRTWHQMMRRYVSTIGKSAARFLGAAPGTWLSARIQLLVGFSVSGLAHVPGDMMVHPYWTGASYLFFLFQALAITVEDAVVAAGRRVGIRESWGTWLVGYVWTIAWFSWSTPFFIDWALAAGLGNHRVFPSSAVRPALEFVAAKTGVDVLGWVAQKGAEALQ